MSFFKDQYYSVALPIQEEGQPVGLRLGQIGAIHAVAAHFAFPDQYQPALIAMPTGSGKTGVLMTVPYLLRASRVLVITPSKLVRDQLRREFEQLELLKTIGVLPIVSPLPRVKELKGRITKEEDWKALEAFDVVIATPNSTSPDDIVPVPPADLFDLVLVDEAHHSVAKTWNTLIAAFPTARRLLVTATPFRRDRREIQAKLIFSYGQRRAAEHGIFSKVRFISVTPGTEDPDVAIARAAEVKFRADRANNLDHYLMVRADSKPFADSLETIYSTHTGLRLRTIHSDHTYARILQAIADLRSGQIDGVICVNMMGEGFDFPNLKIAAVHRPHKSLAVTLQFVGRFVRPNAPNLGEATFLATPSDVTLERERIYDEDAVWQDLIINLADSRIEDEEDARSFADKFQRELDDDDDPDSQGLSLSVFKPTVHAKVFKLKEPPDLKRPVKLPQGAYIPKGCSWLNQDDNVLVFVFRTETKPKWAQGAHFMAYQYELCIVYFDASSHLLFLNSTVKLTEFYDLMASSFTDHAPRILPRSRLARVLSGMTDPRFYNVGMANRLQSMNVESYRILTGPSTEQVISPKDAQLYHSGHVFGGDDASTVGFSSSSKIWSTAREPVHEFVKWCKEMASRLSSNERVDTGSNLDLLDTGTIISVLPSIPVTALVDHGAFREPPSIEYVTDDGELVSGSSLLDFDVRVIPEECSECKVCIQLVHGEFAVKFFHVIAGEDGWFYEPQDEEVASRVKVGRRGQEVTMNAYLNSHPCSFYFSDFAALYGCELFEGPKVEVPALDDDQFRVIDWSGSAVDITKEVSGAAGGLKTIHEFLKDSLQHECDCVFYDHRTGEIADFVGLTHSSEGLLVTLFHCKASKSEKSSQRQLDYNEVCAQLIYSLRWVLDMKRLQGRIEERSRTGSTFTKGNLQSFRALMSASKNGVIRYKLVVVQPGISKQSVGELGELLAATSAFVANSRGQRFELMCSA